MTPARLFLETLAARGITVSARGDKLRVRPRDLADADLIAVLQAHKAELLAELLDEKQPLRERPHNDGLQPRTRPAEAADWPADLADWVLTLTTDDLPAVPFTLAPGRTVVDASRWLGRLQADVRRLAAILDGWHVSGSMTT